MMLLLAALYAWIAVNMLVDGTGPRDGLIHTMWPTWVRVAEWSAAAVIAVVFAWRTKDWPGWVVLLLPPLIRAASYVYGGAVWILSDGAEGVRTGIFDAALYVFMTGLVLLCAGWPDYPPRTPLEKADSGVVA